MVCHFITFTGVGRCKCSFWFAVAHDVFGVFIMMVGVFGGLAVHDLFIYAGAIVIFLSLIWWVFWYAGNIEVPPEELEDDVGLIKRQNRGLRQAVRRASDFLSSRIRSSLRGTGPCTGESFTGASRSSNASTDMSLSSSYESTVAPPSEEPMKDTLN
uniref:Uncharacterized protein n=1 Tax=Mola mola TaxID=94237 RepID=A0A3Q4AKE2_MOLML